MDIKFSKLATYCDGLPPIKSQKPLNSWSHEVTWQIKMIKSSILQCLWSRTCFFPEDLWEATSLKVTWPDVDHVLNWYNYISTFTRLMASDLGRALTSERIVNHHRLFVFFITNYYVYCSSEEDFQLGANKFQREGVTNTELSELNFLVLAVTAWLLALCFEVITGIVFSNFFTLCLVQNPIHWHCAKIFCAD